jgi:hypothetical protein
MVRYGGALFAKDEDDFDKEVLRIGLPRLSRILT